ncbi:MAG: MFS transporter [Candidatus Helarchaeales archaeon]
MKKRQLFTVINFVILASLDNAALAILPASTTLLMVQLQAPESVFVLIFLLTTLVTKITAFFWGFRGDQVSRKRLLFIGTIIWSSLIFLSGISWHWMVLLMFHVGAGFGLGCIESVGFSIILDYIPPKWRGIAMSLWGVSQGIGSAVGYMMAFFLDPFWNLPFIILAIITFGFIMTYPITLEPERGATEEELKELREKGFQYDYIIKTSDIKDILRKKTNIWIISEAFFSQMFWGAIQFLPAVFTWRLLSEGLALSAALDNGKLIAGLFEIGAAGTLLFGYLGDYFYKKSRRARPIISAAGTLIGVPLFCASLILPFNPFFVLIIIFAIIAALCLSAEDPNDLAMIAEINLPEHRGTLFGLMTAISGFGRVLGIQFMLMGLIAFTPLFGSANAWTFSMLLVMTSLIFTGFFFILSIWTTPKDVLTNKAILKERGRVHDKK